MRDEPPPRTRRLKEDDMYDMYQAAVEQRGKRANWLWWTEKDWGEYTSYP